MSILRAFYYLLSFCLTLSSLSAVLPGAGMGGRLERLWVDAGLSVDLQEENRFTFLGMLVVFTWHYCLRLPLPSERSMGLLSPSDQALVLNRRLATSHRTVSIHEGAHDWPHSRCIPTIWGRCSQPTLQGQPQNRGQTPSSWQSP